MTANDSKSTPKKAEDATRHPLALLRELVGDWDRERGRHYFAPGCRPLSDYKGHYTYKVLGRCIEQVLAVMTQMETQESALRAQAEADQDLREVARTLHMYSRRYCDGRSTYAPDDHNRATHTLLRLGVILDADPISKTGPFAADGMYGLTEREHAALAQAGGES